VLEVLASVVTGVTYSTDFPASMQALPSKKVGNPFAAISVERLRDRTPSESVRTTYWIEQRGPEKMFVSPESAGCGSPPSVLEGACPYPPQWHAAFPRPC
jgi:hypothetical protein